MRRKARNKNNLAAMSEARALTFAKEITDEIKLGRRDGAQRKEYSERVRE